MFTNTADRPIFQAVGSLIDLKPGRNESCPCGSGKKYKTCCGRLSSGTGTEPSGGQLQLADVPRVELEALVALLGAGRLAELEGRARALLETRPHSGFVWQLLGIALSKQGKDALQPLTAAAKYLPDDPSVHLNLGNALGRSGRLEEAAASYGRALAIQPDFAEAHDNLGDVQLELGRPAEAAVSFRRAIRIRPDFAGAHQNLGKVLLRLGRNDEALDSCRHAIRLTPDRAEAHNSLGNVLSRLAQPEGAIASFRRAIALQPDFAEAHANLANALRSIGRLDEAVEGYRLALQIKPDFASACTELATALRLQRRGAESEAACREAMRIAPGSSAALAVLAELRADIGRFSEAEDFFRRAAAIDPNSAEAWAGLARVRRMTTADDAWLRAAQGLAERGLPPQREILLRHAIGKYFDDIKDFPNAFLNFQRANELARRCAPGHDRGHLRRTIDLIIRSHDSAWFSEKRATATSSQRPVFIVGMLRSGTTLAEQILASHPAVFGAGELTFWSAELAALLTAASAANTRQLQVDDARLASLGDGYLGLLEQMSADATRVVDKLPTNFLALGLIHAAFPNARIIHMRRNPLDTCLSIYFQHFEAANTYTHDLEDLADYYREYQRLMDHWRTVLPAGAVLDVPYEGLVANAQVWARAMLEFVALPWDPRCLEFHRTPRTVVTASKWQVRQALDTSSINRWHHYEKHIGPLLSLLQRDPD
jgi:tetratricopeptide (TPR) repeat protein